MGNLDDRFISKSAYARHREVSPAMVTEWTKAGRIKIVEGKVDVLESDAMLARSLDPARGGKGGKSRRFGQPETPAPTSVAQPAPAPDPSASSFQRHRALREEYAAKTARTEYEKAIGALVQVERVNLATEEAFSNVRRSMQRIPDVLAARLAAESDPRKVRALLAEEIERALTDLADTVATLPERLTATQQ